MTTAIARDPIYRHRRFQSETIELCVRWHLTYRLSYRDLVEMMAERGVTTRDQHSSIGVGVVGMDDISHRWHWYLAVLIAGDDETDWSRSDADMVGDVG